MKYYKNLIDLSPVSKIVLDDFHASDFLDSLYRPNDIVSITFARKANNKTRKTDNPCILVYKVNSFFFRAYKNECNQVFTNEEVDKMFESYGDGGMFFTPTLSGVWSQKHKDAKFTYRAKENFVSFPYFVLECDDETISKDEQAKHIISLLDKLNVKSVIDSGNKSLHALIANPFPSHKELALKELTKIKNIIPNIFDKNGLSLISGSRLPNILRNVNNKQQNQSFLYLNK